MSFEHLASSNSATGAVDAVAASNGRPSRDSRRLLFEISNRGAHHGREVVSRFEVGLILADLQVHLLAADFRRSLDSRPDPRSAVAGKPGLLAPFAAAHLPVAYGVADVHLHSCRTVAGNSQ